MTGATGTCFLSHNALQHIQTKMVLLMVPDSGETWSLSGDMQTLGKVKNTSYNVSLFVL